MIKTTKDGRTIRTGTDYSKFRVSIYDWQEGLCGRCGRPVLLSEPLESSWSLHVHHVIGRGMGGGKRDDNILLCEGLCGECHRKEHNQ